MSERSCCLLLLRRPVGGVGLLSPCMVTTLALSIVGLLQDCSLTSGKSVITWGKSLGLGGSSEGSPPCSSLAIASTSPLESAIAVIQELCLS